MNRRDSSGTEGEPGIGHNSATFGELLEDAAETTGKVARFAALRVAGAASLLLTSQAAGPLGNPEAGKRIQALQRTVFYQTRAVSSRTIEAALIEARGGVVKLRPDGTPFDHINKLREAQTGLRGSIRGLQEQLGAGRLSEDQAIGAVNGISRASRALDIANRTLQKVEDICSKNTACSSK